MRQVCFNNSEFVNYVNENMVVLYGFNWSGRNLIIDGEKVETKEAFTPYEPDEKVKNVVPFAEPLVTKKLSGKLKGKYYLKDISDEIQAAGIPKTEYGVIDANGNKLVDYQTFQQALEVNITPQIFMDYFRQANDQLKQKNETQISGSDWRKGYWNLLQSEYYMKEKELDKSLEMLFTVLDEEVVLESYKKEAKKLQEKMAKKLDSYIEGFSKKLSDEEKREKAILAMREIYVHFEEYDDVTDKIKEVCKDNDVSKADLLGEEAEE